MTAGASPNSTFVGIDNQNHSLRAPANKSQTHALCATSVWNAVTPQRPNGGLYELICFLDALHDMGDPDAAIRKSRRQIVDTGSVMLFELAGFTGVLATAIPVQQSAPSRPFQRLDQQLPLLNRSVEEYF